MKRRDLLVGAAVLTTAPLAATARPAPLGWREVSGMNPTRRTLLGGAAVLAAAPGISVAAEHPDSELIAIGALFEAAWDKEQEAWDNVEADADEDPWIKQAEELNGKTRAFAERISRTRATTAAGLLVKVRTLDWMSVDSMPYMVGYSHHGPVSAESIMGGMRVDIFAMAGDPLPTWKGAGA